jgi:uncharacterized protein YdhG (YjbR/CyaY superfamily)
MKMKTTRFTTVEEYISGFPAKTKALLKEMRKLIKATAPGAEEVISYNMPAFKLNGMLVYYAGNKAHIGFYPTSSPIRVFKEELSGYKTSKGAIQFPIETGIPASLVKKIVKFRIKENIEKQKLKGK